MTTPLNTLGAALMIDELEDHLEWLTSGKRDLEIQDFSQHKLLDGDWQAQADKAKALLEGYPGRMGIHGPFWGLSLANPDPLLRDAVKKRLEGGVKVAAQLGATHMVVHSPIDPWMHRHIAYDAVRREEIVDLMKDTLTDVLAQAEDVGCTLVMENIMDLDPRVQLELVKAVDSDALRVSLDVGHAFCMHVQHGAPPPDRFVSEVGEYLEHLHIQDTDGYLDRHWLPGEGSVNFKALTDAVSALKRRPKLIIEVKEKASVQRAAAWLSEPNLAREPVVAA